MCDIRDVSDKQQALLLHSVLAMTCLADMQCGDLKGTFHIARNQHNLYRSMPQLVLVAGVEQLLS